MTTPCAAPSTPPRPGALPGGILLALLCVLPPAARARAGAEDACHAEFRAGAHVWYAVPTHARVSTTVASGCTVGADRQPAAFFLVEGDRELIVCDVELILPDAMKAELEAAQLQGATVLPSRRPTLVATWSHLVRKYSAQLQCKAGSRRMSDPTGAPSVWCRRQLTARELCPSGTTYAEGVCSSMDCAAGMVDLDRLTGGRLAGCFRCPAGRLDVEESVSWRAQSLGSSSGQGSATSVLCKARATDPCPAPRREARRSAKHQR